MAARLSDKGAAVPDLRFLQVPTPGAVKTQLEDKEPSMKQSHLSILLAGLLAVAGVQAQSTSASGSSDLPPKAGEASTQTYGAPNAATTNSPVTEAPKTREMIRQEAQGMGAAAATTAVPGRAGEASTMVHGQPNIDPNTPPLPARYYRDVGVPATLPEGSPSVFQGGTPQ